MSNELRIKPLLKYEVILWNEGQFDSDIFTAEAHSYDVVSNSVKFYRTGNIIREYFNREYIRKIIVTPIDA
jgi:hypothetical protein